jgi:hypothetical protein
VRISGKVKKNRPLGGGPTSHILPATSDRLRQVEPARYFGSITPGRTRQPLRFLAYSIRLKSIAASISCLLNAYSMQLQAGGDFDHKFDPSVDLVVVVSL